MDATNKFPVPEWASKPPLGLYLILVEDKKLIEKLDVSSKKCYLFGRDKKQCDYSIDHDSWANIHAALVYNKNTKEFYLIDLGSAHGTFIGGYQIESQKPTTLPRDIQFHFGNSSRMFLLKESLLAKNLVTEEVVVTTDEGKENKLTEKEVAFDGSIKQHKPDVVTPSFIFPDLLKLNTKLNKRSSLIAIPTDDPDHKKNSDRKKRKRVCILKRVEIINPEDRDVDDDRVENSQPTIAGDKALEKTKGEILTRERELVRAAFNQPGRVVPGKCSNKEKRGTLVDIKDEGRLDIPLSVSALNFDAELEYYIPGQDSQGSPDVPKCKYKQENWPGKNIVHIMLV